MTSKLPCVTRLAIKEPEYISNYLGHSSLSDLLGGANAGQSSFNANTPPPPPRAQASTPNGDANSSMQCLQYNNGLAM